MSNTSKPKLTLIVLSVVLAFSGFFYLQPGRVQARELELRTPSSTYSSCQTRHTVRWGENLFRIGLKYNLTWTPIAAANGISNPNLIYAGQVLCIPTSTRSNSGSTRTSQIPTLKILSVVRNKRVTIQTDNFPSQTKFVVTMGKYGTKGIGGIEVATTESGSDRTFNATYSIPHALRGQDRIAIRLQSASGYYSYNWFYNNSTN